jgi:hypothetical protein
MSDVGVRDEKQYNADFPLDFGRNVRGSLLHDKEGNSIGILFVHRLPNDGTCGGSVYWDKTWVSRGTRMPTWKLESLDPMTLDPSIRCSCNFHGHITNGRWVFAGDSPYQELHAA